MSLADLSPPAIFDSRFLAFGCATMPLQMKRIPLGETVITVALTENEVSPSGALAMRAAATAGLAAPRIAFRPLPMRE